MWKVHMIVIEERVLHNGLGRVDDYFRVELFILMSRDFLVKNFLDLITFGCQRGRFSDHQLESCMEIHKLKV